MLTVSFEMTPAMAKELARAADLLGMKNADVAREATRLLLRSVLPAKPGRPLGKRRPSTGSGKTANIRLP
jgi:hypothetical protein